MFEDLVKDIKKAVERIKRAFKAVVRMIRQKIRCMRHEHSFAIQKWHYVHGPFGEKRIVALVKCTGCGESSARFIRDEKAIRKIKKQAGSLREKGWDSV